MPAPGSAADAVTTTRPDPRKLAHDAQRVLAGRERLTIGDALTLEFPNRSRSFDEVRSAVRFMGHDGMFEVPFFVEAEALATRGKGSPSESECLSAFDAARNSIHDVAREAYPHGRRNAYTLDVAFLVLRYHVTARHPGSRRRPRPAIPYST